MDGSILIYAKATVTRSLLEHVFRNYKTLIATELESLSSLLNSHCILLIVAGLDAGCLRVTRTSLLVPILIVANTDSSEPFDSDLANQCVKLGAALVQGLETSAVLSRAGSLIRRFQAAQVVFNELNGHGPSVFSELSSRSGIDASRSHCHRSNSDRPLDIHSCPRDVDGHRYSYRAKNQIDSTSAIQEAGGKMWQPLRSPRTSVGMSQRRTAGVLKLVKECLGMSRDESSYRSVRDVMRLISKFESRLAGRSTTQSSNCVKEFYSSNKRTDENYKSIAWNNTNLRKELRVILQPKVVDVLLKNDYEHIPPRQFRCSPSTLLLQRGYYLYRGRQYEEACGFFDLAVARDSREVMGFFWRALAGARLGFYLQATRDLDRALDLTLREKVVLHEARNTIREQQRQKVELAIRFNRSVARVSMPVSTFCIQSTLCSQSGKYGRR